MKLSFFDKFVQYAAQHQAYIESGESGRANLLYKKISKMYWDAKASQQTDIFLEGLNNANAGVALWSSVFLLSTHPVIALAKLEELEKLPTIVSMSAFIAIDAYNKGMKLFHN